MRRPVLVMTMMAFATTAMAEDLESPVATDSRWDLTVAAGASSTTTALPGMQLMGARSSSAMTSASDLEASGLFALRYRVTDRVEWSIPTLSFAYLGGAAGEREWIPWAGLTSWGAGYSSIEHLILQGSLGAGAGVREWLTPRIALNATADVASRFDYRSKQPCGDPAMCPAGWSGPDSWRATITAGSSLRVGDAWTFNIAAGASQQLLVDGAFASGSTERATSLSLGSIQTIGLRTLPLVELHLDPRWSVDGYAMAAYNLSAERFEQTYLVGMTRRWPD